MNQRFRYLISTLCLSLPLLILIMAIFFVSPFQEKPRNVIVVVVDTLRADFLGTYGFQASISPEIDSFAAQSFVFQNAFAAAPWTKPSIASLFTGLPVKSHIATSFIAIPEKYRYGSEVLSENLVTIAEIFKASQFKTAGFSGNTLISKLYGFNQGFDYFKDTNSYHSYSDQAIIDDATAWLKQNDSDRFFLYLHFMGAHGPYQCERSKFESFNDSGIVGEDMLLQDSMLPNKGEYLPQLEWMSDEQVHHLNSHKACYAAGIANFDEKFGRFLHWLKSAGYFDNTVIVFTSDHGEGFLEHGKWGHGNSMHVELLHVPLIVYIPNYLQQILKIPVMVGLTDIPKTLVEILGISNQYSEFTKSVGDGIDLVQFMNPESVNIKRAGGLLSSGRISRSPCYAYTSERFRLINCEGTPDGIRIYDRISDPLEKHDMYSTLNSELRELIQEAKVKYDSQPDPSQVERFPLKPGSLELQKLKSLGYLSNYDSSHNP